MMNAYDWRRVCIGIVLGTIILAGCILAFGGKADAAKPYGGCKEVYQVLDGTVSVHSDGARYCRQHGWIVRRNVVVDPFGQAVVNVPECKNEDESKRVCYWDSLGQGNKRGHGFIALPGRTVYVDGVNGDYVTSKRMRLGYWYAVPYDV